MACDAVCIQQGHAVTVRLKIGKMTCLEYAAMKGYADLLSELMSKSICYETLRQYFALDGKHQDSGSTEKAGKDREPESHPPQRVAGAEPLEEA